ncbi:MAG: CoB--CoM heterodisulfide reductase iron-sulfur subunit B family protein [Syntrophobacterales bacterium]|nr:MAG: CoB--CoM heterodisulfide reductase iron-sulfur subunit B family protein [Syntrophobacterales bacterium]
MEFLYFPGCTLNTKAQNLDEAGRGCAKVLGFELKELSNWTCCGATFPLAKDDIMALAPPARLLARAKEEGSTLTTLCSVCFNVIKRTNQLIKGDEEKREKINTFIEMNYQGDVQVLHYLEILKREVGFDTMKGALKRNLQGMKVAPFYGCMLLRPFEEMEFDDKEAPKIFEEFLDAINCEPVDFPYKIECCGAFQSVGAPEVAVECAYAILNSALRNGAEAVTTTCPLCQFNIDNMQREIHQRYNGFPGIPIIYFTQLLGVALGLPVETLEFHRNDVDPRPLLKKKGLL